MTSTTMILLTMISAALTVLVDIYALLLPKATSKALSKKGFSIDFDKFEGIMFKRLGVIGLGFGVFSVYQDLNHWNFIKLLGEGNTLVPIVVMAIVIVISLFIAFKFVVLFNSSYNPIEDSTKLKKVTTFALIASLLLLFFKVVLRLIIGGHFTLIVAFDIAIIVGLILASLLLLVFTKGAEEFNLITGVITVAIIALFISRIILTFVQIYTSTKHMPVGGIMLTLIFGLIEIVLSFIAAIKLTSVFAARMNLNTYREE